MFQMTPEATFYSILSQNEPQAIAKIAGNNGYPTLHGSARFFQTPYSGLLIEVEVSGLPNAEQTPVSQQGSPASLNSPHFYGMHIHEVGDCTLPFDKTGNHYNPNQLPHPQHTGDLPPLLSSNGYSFVIFYDGLLTIDDIAGRSLIIHAHPDDFTTQPSGNSGNKIGCGVIHRISSRKQ